MSGKLVLLGGNWTVADAGALAVAADGCGESVAAIPAILRDDAIGRKTLESHRISFPITIWDKNAVVSCDPAYKELRHELLVGRECISRQNIFDLVDQTSAQGSVGSHEVKKIFLAVMIWGYGNKPGWVNVGAHRVGAILSTPDFCEKIRCVHQKIAVERDVESAYEMLARSNRIKGFGQSFFTKFFYFLGDGCLVKPLILDKFVWNGLRSIGDVSRYESDNKNPSVGYMSYIQDMKAWADELGVEPWQIEYFLFSHQ